MQMHVSLCSIKLLWYLCQLFSARSGWPGLCIQMHFIQIWTTANYYKYSFFPLTVVQWNNLLSQAILSDDPSSFRSIIPYHAMDWAKGWTATQILFNWSSRFFCWSTLLPFCVTHKNSVDLEEQLQKKSTGLAQKSPVEDQRISG